MRDSWKLGLLLIVHAAGGLLIPVVARSSHFELVGSVLWFAVPPCEAGLLGTWTAFSGAAWPRRLAGLVVGTGYLTLLIFAFEEHRSHFHAATALSAITTAGILLVIRRTFAQLVRRPSPLPEKRERTLRFSIRGLMLLTLAVALLASAFRSMRGAVGYSSEWLFLSAFNLCEVTVSLAACWAALGRARVLARSLTVVVFSAVLGTLLAVGLTDHEDFDFDRFLMIWLAAVLGLEAVLSLASLLVVRSCGYRLVRRPAPDRPFSAPAWWTRGAHPG